MEFRRLAVIQLYSASTKQDLPSVIGHFASQNNVHGIFEIVQFSIHVHRTVGVQRCITATDLVTHDEPSSS